jgi:hypothetical protein
MRLDEPGRYLMACPVAQGSTLEAEGSRPPHFAPGQFAGFRIA